MAKRTSSGNSNLTGQAVSTLTSLSTTPGKENMSATGSKPTLHFTLYVHPLETLASIKKKVAEYCECPVTSVEAISVSGRLARAGSRAQGNDSTQLSLNVVAENSIVDQLGIVHGCELIVVSQTRKRQRQIVSQAPKARRFRFDIERKRNIHWRQRLR
jgi:hypothetical protein